MHRLVKKKKTEMNLATLTAMNQSKRICLLSRCQIKKMRKLIEQKLLSKRFGYFENKKGLGPIIYSEVFRGISSPSSELNNQLVIWA